MGTKSMAVLQILQILRKYSNKEHALTQKQIADYLESDYGIVIERKAVARHSGKPDGGIPDRAYHQGGVSRG